MRSQKFCDVSFLRMIEEVKNSYLFYIQPLCHIITYLSNFDSRLRRQILESLIMIM